MNDAECPPNDPAAQAMSPLREDGFLGGRLRIAQPVRGYRAGADAVMLAVSQKLAPRFAVKPGVIGQKMREFGLVGFAGVRKGECDGLLRHGISLR